MELFKLRVQNLGRIADAELSIRPLTVFIGPNNTNKTWTAYALYGLARWFSGAPGAFWRPTSDGLDSLIEADEQLQRVTNSTVSRVLSSWSSAPENATVLEEITRAEILQDVTYPIQVFLHPQGIAQLLGVSAEQTRDANVVIEMTREQFSLSRVERISFELRKGRGCDATLTDKDGTVRERIVQAGIPPSHERVPDSFLRKGIQRVLFQQHASVVAFPAERKGLVTVYNLLERGFPDLVNPPVVEFVRLLQESQAVATHIARPSEVPAAVSLLEEKLLDGNVDFGAENTPLALTYTRARAPSLKMPAASSLVRALAGLDIYLKYLANPSDLLIIDEPEMNAHPEAQLMITELLGVLVNSGIHVVVTTHSPYIVDHVNNLIEAAHLPDARQDEMASRFKLGTKEAFVPLENVSTYLFSDDGDVTDILNREERDIDWSTFGKTSDRVGNLYSEILGAARRE